MTFTETRDHVWAEVVGRDIEVLEVDEGGQLQHLEGLPRDVHDPQGLQLPAAVYDDLVKNLAGCKIKQFLTKVSNF
jgi:hypothetical protein